MPFYIPTHILIAHNTHTHTQLNGPFFDAARRVYSNNGKVSKNYFETHASDNDDGDENTSENKDNHHNAAFNHSTYHFNNNNSNNNNNYTSGGPDVLLFSRHLANFNNHNHFSYNNNTNNNINNNNNNTNNSSSGSGSKNKERTPRKTAPSAAVAAAATALANGNTKRMKKSSLHTTLRNIVVLTNPVHSNSSLAVNNNNNHNLNNNNNNNNNHSDVVRALGKRGRKRKVFSDKEKEKLPELQLGIVCRLCKATETPEWRRGPDGPKTLCNACGLQYKKQRATEAKKRSLEESGEPVRTQNAAADVLVRLAAN